MKRLKLKLTKIMILRIPMSMNTNMMKMVKKILMIQSLLIWIMIH
ncbi:Uncharacterised protein [Chlamydia trachomatis]|nr:Uncharacterised protein [Chlamydia trachomatis]